MKLKLLLHLCFYEVLSDLNLDSLNYSPSDGKNERTTCKLTATFG